MRTKLPILLAVLAFPALAFHGCNGKPAGYSIRADMTGCSSGDSLILARYEGSKTIPLDTLPCMPGGTVFKGTKTLKPGMYALFAGERGKIDFLISDTLNQSITMKADAANILSTASFEGSPENTAFTGFLRMISEQSDLRQRLSRNAGTPDSVFRLDPEVNRLRKEIPVRSAELEKQYAGTLLALFLRTAREPKVPQPTVPLMVQDKNMGNAVVASFRTLGPGNLAVHLHRCINDILSLDQSFKL